MNTETELPHLRAACDKARKRMPPLRPTPEMLDDIDGSGSLIAWVAVAVALGVFLFVAMAVL